MRFRCRKFDLQNELAALASVVDKKSKDEVLSCVRLTKMLDGTLAMSGSSRVLMLSTSIKIDGSATALLGASPTSGGEEAMAVSADKLYELCKKLPDQIIEVDYDSTKLKAIVRCGTSRFTLGCQEPSLFPSIRTPESYSYKIPRVFFTNAIKNCLNFLSDKEATQIFYSGVLISLSDKILEVVATDGVRLASWYTTLETDKKFNVVLPKKTLTELCATLESASGAAINLEVTPNLAFINFNKYTYQSGILVGSWPNYQPVLDVVRTTNDISFRIQRAQLQSALERCLLFVGKNQGFGVDFTFTGKELALAAANESGDHAHEIVSAEGPINYETRLNGDFVLKYLATVPTDDTIDLFVNNTEPLKPQYFRSQVDRNYIFLVTPMQRL